MSLQNFADVILRLELKYVCLFTFSSSLASSILPRGTHRETLLSAEYTACKPRRIRLCLCAGPTTNTLSFVYLSQQGKESATSRERIPIYFGPMFHNFDLADPAHRRAESLPRRREKATRACERCRTFRIKCGEKKPCSRCMNDKVRCVFSSLPSAEEQEQEPTTPVLAGYESSLDVKL